MGVEPAPEHLQKIADEFSDKTGQRRCRLFYTNDNSQSNSIYGEIYLAPRFLRNFTIEEQAAVLSHEMTHDAQRDSQTAAGLWTCMLVSHIAAIASIATALYHMNIRDAALVLAVGTALAPAFFYFLQQEEYSCDLTGARTQGTARHLISSLKKIREMTCLSEATLKKADKSFLLSTHPGHADRIAALEKAELTLKPG